MVLTLPSAMIDRARKWWPELERNVFRELGNTATIFEFGAPRRSGNGLSATTFTTRASHANGLEAICTPSTALDTWATRFDLNTPANWQGIIPVLTFNGTSDNLVVPDNNYWTRGDGATDSPFSIGMWIYGTGANLNSMTFFAKNGAGAQEWQLYTQSGAQLSFIARDNSVPAFVGRGFFTALPTGQWLHIVATYSGNGAASGFKIYRNAAQVDDTNVTSGVYVAMENLAAAPTIGSGSGGGVYAAVKIAGGPVGPFFTQVELTAAQAKNLYLLGADALGL